MLALIGSISLAVAFVFALLTLVLGVAAGRRDSNELTEVSRYGVYVVFGCVAVASSALVAAFLSHDFSIKYVHHYSDTRMPTMYLLSAFWGGQKGSLLFWAMVLSAASAAAVTVSRHRVPELMPWVHVVLMAILGFFLGLLVFLSPPFETYYLLDVPIEGGGLNPVLQNYWMAIHPPCLLAGYSLFGVPFAFGAAALIKGRLGTDWIKVTRRWLLFSWTFLSLGCLLGARWAYEELGWGGYWAWDPVENAAILPWFTATALIHSVMIQERRGMLKRWNFFLLVLTFWLTIFGTFLTRSGMIASVHTFAESSIGPAFLVLVIIVALVGGALLASRWRAMGSKDHLHSYVSREGVFLLNNWILLGFMFVVLWGTIGPKLRDLVTGEDTTLGAAWYNRFAVPFGIAVLFFMAIGMLIAWRKSSVANIRKSFGIPLIVSVLITPLVAFGYSELRLEALDPQTSVASVAVAWLAIFMCVFGLTIIASEFWRGMRARRRHREVGWATAFFSLIAKHRRRYGGYIVHVGFILLCFGIAGNAYKIKQTATMEIGDSVPLGDYLLTFESVDQEVNPNKLAVYATLSMRRCARDNGRLILDDCSAAVPIRPARFDYNDYSRGGEGDPMKVTSEIAILSGPLEDVYVTIAGWRNEANIVTFEMFVNPFTLWMWIGGVILVGGAIVCMWPAWPPTVTSRRRHRLLELRPLFDRLAMLIIALMPAATLLGGPPVSAQEIPARSSPAPEVSGPDRGSLNPGQPLVTAPSDLDPSAWTHDEAGVALVEPTRTEGTAASELYSQINCQCGSCGRKAVDQCQAQCQWGIRARRTIDEMVAEGATSEEILGHFEAQFGTLAIAIPEEPGIVWIAPVGAVLAGLVLLVFALRTLSRRPATALVAGAAVGPSSSPTADSPAVDEPYFQRLADELDELD